MACDRHWHVVKTGRGDAQLLITGMSRMKDEPEENAFISNGLFYVRMKVQRGLKGVKWLS